jgi:hypothetical protein
MRLTVKASPKPKAARTWTARSDTKDFRESRWESAPLAPGPTMRWDVPPPEKGYIALFADLDYEIDDVGYHLSTQIGQQGAKPAH